MTGPRDTTPGAARPGRIAWLVRFAVPMAVLALLFALKPAGAASGSAGPEEPIATPLARAEIEEPDEGEWEQLEGACTEAVAEPEEGEDATGEPGGEEEALEEEVACEPRTSERNAGLSHQCMLRSARAHLLAFGSNDRVRLVIRYSSFAPASATIDYKLNGHGTSRRLGMARRRIARSGLLRITERLGPGEMARVLTARSFTVTMRVDTAPRYCHRLYTRHLTVKRTAGRRAVWLQSGGGSRKGA